MNCLEYTVVIARPQGIHRSVMTTSFHVSVLASFNNVVFAQNIIRTPLWNCLCENIKDT